MPDVKEFLESYANLLKESGVKQIFDNKVAALANKVNELLKITTTKPEDVENMLKKNGIDIIVREKALPPIMTSHSAKTFEDNFEDFRKGNNPEGSGRDHKGTDLSQICDLYDLAAYVDNFDKVDYSPNELKIKFAIYKTKKTNELKDIFTVCENKRSGSHTKYANGWQKLCSLAKLSVFNSEDNRKAYDNYPEYESMKKELKSCIELGKIYGIKIPEYAEKLINKIEKKQGDLTLEQATTIYNDWVGVANHYIPDNPQYYVYIKCKKCGVSNKFNNFQESQNKNCTSIGCGEPLYEKCPACGKQTIASKDFCIHSGCEFFLAGAKIFDYYYEAAENALSINKLDDAKIYFSNAKTANKYRTKEIEELDKLIKNEENKLKAIEAKKIADEEAKKVAKQKAIKDKEIADLMDKYPKPCGKIYADAKNGYIDVTWGAAADKYINYILLRKEGSTPVNEKDGIIIAEGEELLNYKDKDIQSGINYSYGVFTQRQGGKKLVSSLVTDSAVLLSKPLPPNLIENAGKLNITWKMPQNCKTVKIKIGKANNPINAKEIYNGSGESFIDENLQPGEKYAYGIIAVYNVGGKEQESEPTLFHYQLPSYEKCELVLDRKTVDGSQLTFKIKNRNAMGDSADYIYYNIRKAEFELIEKNPTLHTYKKIESNSYEVTFENSRFLTGSCVVTVWVRYGEGKFSPPCEISVHI